jgi:Lysophospholipase L1 and related esterases
MKNIKILFQGDSITDGARGRSEDPNHILGHSYAYIAAAKLAYEHTDRNFEFINRGVSGDTSADLYARWQNDAINLKPDIISILVGTNDAGHETKSPQNLVCRRFESTLRLILQQTREILPETRIILMEPFMLNTCNFDNEFYERRLQFLKEKQEVVKRLALEFNIVLVPLQERFNEALKKKPESYWIWDSIHPTYAGHGLIANAWLNDTKELLRV